MPPPQKLEKTIGLWSAITIVIGVIIGSGIFMKPATMASQLPSPYMLITVWIVAGLISMFGALAFAELGTMFPETGGQYVFLRKSFNDLLAYLYGWGALAVINSAAIAGIAFVFAEYLGFFIGLPHFSDATEQSLILHIPLIGNILPLQNIGAKSVAIFLILFLSMINYLSVKSSNSIQLIATILKVSAIVVLIGGIFFFGKGNTANFTTNAPGFDMNGILLFVAFMAATTGAFASYDGWNVLPMVSGEIKDPKRNITRSLVIGLWACIAVYLLITLAFMYVLPIDEMSKSKLVATDAISVVFGNIGGGIVAGLIVVSTFGAVNVNLLTTTRVLFAMGESGTFFPQVAKVHKKYKTPGVAIWVMGIWSCILVISGSFDMLFDMFIFISEIFYALVIIGLFILRKRMPDAERPYKVWGYPYVPLVFLLFIFAYVISTLYYDITNYLDGKTPFINSVLGLVLTAIGIPIYYYFKRKNGKLPDM